MEEIGQLKDRLERKDKDREQYYVEYIRELEEKYRREQPPIKTDNQSKEVKIEEGENE